MINLKKLILILFITNTGCLLQSKQPTTLFCHGIVDSKSQADRYQDFLQEPKVAFDFPDAQEPSGLNFNNLIFNSCAFCGKKPVNLEKMYMGQGPDITALKKQIHPKESYVLYGLSRGGSTIVNYLAQNNPKNIQAVVLDAAPADMVSTVNILQHTIGYKLAPTRAYQEYVFNTLFPAYPINSITPLQDIARINNKNLPVLIVHSHKDTRVHISSAWQLYLAFKQAHFTNVYLLELTQGTHAHYMKGPEKNVYLNALHSFYKKYNLAHNSEQSNINLQELQPSQSKISEKLQTYYDQLEDTYQKQNQFNKNIIAGLLLITGISYLYRP